VTWRSIEPQSAEAADGFVVWSALTAAMLASMRRSQNRALFSFVFGLGVQDLQVNWFVKTSLAEG
jgi:hypothetical protein